MDPYFDQECEIREDGAHELQKEVVAVLTKEREEEFLKEWKSALHAVPHQNCASEIGYACDCKLGAPLQRLNNLVVGFLYLIKRGTRG